MARLGAEISGAQSSRGHDGIGATTPVLFKKDRKKSCHHRGGVGTIGPITKTPNSKTFFFCADSMNVPLKFLKENTEPFRTEEENPIC